MDDSAVDDTYTVKPMQSQPRAPPSETLPLDAPVVISAASVHVAATTSPSHVQPSADTTGTLEMFVLDMKENDECIDIYGVEPSGSSALLRVSGFRNFFYVKLASICDGSVVANIHSTLAEALGLKAASHVELSVVQRVPLFACYEEALRMAKVRAETDAQPGAKPSVDFLPSHDALRAAPVSWLRVAHGPKLKPKEMLEKLRRAPSLSSLFEIDEAGDLVSYEDDLAPAGTTKLLRRFAVEKQLAGGAWLHATVQRITLDASRCAAEYTCPHEQVHDCTRVLLLHMLYSHLCAHHLDLHDLRCMATRQTFSPLRLLRNAGCVCHFSQRSRCVLCLPTHTHRDTLVSQLCVPHPSIEAPLLTLAASYPHCLGINDAAMGGIPTKTLPMHMPMQHVEPLCLHICACPCPCL